MTTRLFLALACALILVRLPSLIQPMGADQGLYAYIGERILGGGLPYSDAWDQKPPAVHFTYAALRAIWPHDSVVAAADLLAASGVAWLVYRLGGALSSRGTGQAAALLFLFLSNPAFARQAGVSVRAQCETFIAMAVTAAFLLIARRSDPGGWRVGAAGALLGLAVTFKYNTVVYAAAAVTALSLWNRLSFRSLLQLAAGWCVPMAVMLGIFVIGGALTALYDATVVYNLEYSGKTYTGPIGAARYLLTFPVQHARVDALWLVGGAGCAVLVGASFWRRERLFVPVWVASACLAIAINSSRGLPQYFIQAAPALALAAALAGALVWTRWRVVNAIALAIVAVGVWRVNDFSKLVDNTWHDTQYVFGRIDRATHLARYGDRETRKYSALAVAELGEYLRTHTSPDEHVFVFGFSCGAYVAAERMSASRFAWSRPVIVGFNDHKPGYGVTGLLDDLRATPPAIVALQLNDWAPDVDDSAHFFMNTPALADWLRTRYERVDGPEGFDVWKRRSARP